MSGAVDRNTRDEEQKLVKKIKNYIYDPAQMIGSGFSSNVYKGLNELNGETIAIKVLQLSKIQSEVEKYLLNNEINALRALSHPHVLHTVEILMTKNNVYIMTEFCQRGDLQQYMKRQGRLSQPQALRIIRDIVEGYLTVEQKKIVHRDLKTANIFLTSTGARIADFGFCQFLNEKKKPQLFYNVGSPAYMSPESYRDNVYSPKSDVWSIGIILYEILMGQTPDKNLTYSEMSNNLMAGRIASGSNESIRNILAGCFKKDTKERYSPSELLDAVNQELSRIEQQPKGNSRPQTVQPATSSIKVLTNAPYQPVSPAEFVGNRRQHANRLMNSNSIIPERPGGQSPFKTRFGNNLGREESSPLKNPIERRFREEEPARNSYKEPSNKIKSLTEMLLFLYRLLGFIIDTELQSAQFIRLILFRHRSHLQSGVERAMGEERLDRNNYEPFKEFQFLKGRFDEAYLQKQSQPTSHSIPNNILQKLNELSNQLFTDNKSIKTYCNLMIEGCRECDRISSSSRDTFESQKIGTAWDYLMIHFQILVLYYEGQSIERIAQEILNLATILKDQPKRLLPAHFQLMHLKLASLQQFMEQWKGELRQNRGKSEGLLRKSDIPQRQVLIHNGFF